MAVIYIKTQVRPHGSQTCVGGRGVGPDEGENLSFCPYIATLDQAKNKLERRSCVFDISKVWPYWPTGSV